MPPLAGVREMLVSPDRTSLLHSAGPARETENSGLGDKDIPGTSPESKGSEPPDWGLRASASP